ncbi:MAG: isoaspartyl peptidase/L-asparaginase, partial [Myxococcales bacterium]|nr:isoaspartyl peptidase/L-asparaginase [Myxococcales bacterium]
VLFRSLEDDPRFNAGTGACLAEDGSIELDAAVMEGRSLGAGAVCALPPFREPIAIARAVLAEGRHVLYAGDGARRFAEGAGFSPTTSEALTTDAARARWEQAKRGGTHEGYAGGTVGAVVLARGTVAAATSTGGRANKRRGRVGDSPILGAGTYADDEAAACSTTGDGEAMMRLCVAKTAVEWARAGQDLEEVARGALRLLDRRARGTGGLILVSPTGRIAWARTTATMSWAAHAEGLAEPLAGI